MGLTVIFVLAGVVLFGISLDKHTAHFTSWGAYHGYKILLAIPLGISEEVSWREAHLEDTNNLYQALVWGLNHLVVGEGMSSPWLYGFITLVFAFALGLVPKKFRAARYWVHVMIEYFVMDNLVRY